MCACECSLSRSKPGPGDGVRDHSGVDVWVYACRCVRVHVRVCVSGAVDGWMFVCAWGGVNPNANGSTHCHPRRRHLADRLGRLDIHIPYTHQSHQVVDLQYREGDGGGTGNAVTLWSCTLPHNFISFDPP